MNGAVVRNGVVVNVVVLPDGWTPDSKEWQPEPGCVCVPAENVHIGDQFVSGRFRRTVKWNDLNGRAIPLEIDVHNPPPEVIPIPRTRG